MITSKLIINEDGTDGHKLLVFSCFFGQWELGDKGRVLFYTRVFMWEPYLRIFIKNIFLFHTK